ncbi:hypothetical protein LVD15_18690 [Fulvivirga maritima]|uniref:glycoside hydrolase 5 family protein n=1 Tax=Fulvivirga maritima TaxID=2904247 RepID=UPI001F2F4A51|nr:hypothetical protein [Fulvivirga maritima]UII25318.1 hypothetical protein LVD15_18690 [Fulvivirga maritima]
MNKRTCIFTLVLFYLSYFSFAQQFVTVKDGLLYHQGEPYYFIGTNYWYGMNLGSAGNAGDRERLKRELDHMQELGIKNLRIIGASEGPDDAPYRVVPSLQPEAGKYNEEVFQGLDFLLVEMNKRGMTAAVGLNNFWIWSGGMSQYISWANDSAMVYSPPVENTNWHYFQQHSSSFFANKKANKLYRNFIKTMINRTNTISGIKYKDDPTIMSWQLSNEPRGYANIEAYRKWVDETAHFIQKKDKNHLVSIGSEGNTATHHAGTNFWIDHQSKYIDYATMHIWVENWAWYDPKKGTEDLDSAIYKAKKYLHEHLALSQKMNKPLVLEEFGVARDNGSFEITASTENRNKLFEAIFEEVYQNAGKGLMGCNFWSYSGEGRPKKAAGLWHAGDPFTGDPPHEKQGWYSVYDTDSATLELISKYAGLMNGLPQ